MATAHLIERSSRLKDLSTRRFGKLVALYPICRKKRPTLWVCRCDCGVYKKVRYSNLIYSTRSCGCGRLQDYSGEKYWHLEVLRLVEGKRHLGQRVWLCRCVCGKELEIPQTGIKRQTPRSCGCRRGQCNGVSNLPEYDIWLGIKARCFNAANTGYEYYGGRGITMCQEWKNSFLRFYGDVGPRPSPLHTVERVNHNGHYEPGNVRWIPMSEQSQNRRGLIMITIGDTTSCLAVWCRRFRVGYQCAYIRIKRGLPLQEVFRMARFKTGPKPKQR